MFGYNLGEQAQKLGVKIEKYPGRAVATYNNIRVEAKLVNGNVETTVSGIPKVPYPIKGIIKRTSDGYIAQTILVGPIPLGTVKYKIPYSGFIELIDCCIETMIKIIIVILILMDIYFTITPFPDPGDIFVLLSGIAAIALAPVIAFASCI